MKRIIVTAGPTREAVDPVRFLSNKSTGKMGYAIAEAAIEAFEVVLISGPTNLPKPVGCRVINVVSAADMCEAVLTEFLHADAIVMTAAVADYRPITVADQKLKKSDDDLVIKLERTKDILLEVSKIKKADQVVVGFAAETENLLENAQSKLERKKLDLIVANDVSRSDSGFGSDDNKAYLVSKADIKELPLMKKSELATKIIAEISDRLAEISK